MKTITEFPAPSLKIASSKRQEFITAGKTPEELPPAMGEALKLEGDKLKWMMEALEVVGTRTNDLKRVVVLKLNEGEKVPEKAVAVGEHHFLVEFYPAAERQGAPHWGDRGRDRDRGRGKKGRGKGRGDDRGRRGRPDRPGRPEGAETRGPSNETAPAGDRKPPRRHRPRGPRPAAGDRPLDQVRAQARAEAQAVTGGKPLPLIQPIIRPLESPKMPETSAPAQAPETAETTKTE